MRKRARSPSSSSESLTSSSSTDSSVQENGSDTTSPPSSTTTSSSVSSEDLQRKRLKAKRKRSRKKIKRDSSDSEINERPRIKASKKSKRNQRADRKKHSSKCSVSPSETKTREKKRAINILGSQRHAHKSSKYLRDGRGENDASAKLKSSHKQQFSKQSRSTEGSSGKTAVEKKNKSHPENTKSDRKHDNEQRLPPSTEMSHKNKHRSSPRIREDACSGISNESISAQNPNECTDDTGRDVIKITSSKKHSPDHQTPEKEEWKSGNSANIKEPNKTVEKETSQNEEKVTNKTVETKYDFSDTLDKELEQKKLEEEMLKRKERIEKWRAERKLQEPNVTGVNASTGKSWTLDDDADDDDEETPADTTKEAAADAEDPLDEYMSLISKEVKLAHCEDLGNTDKGKSKQDDKEVPANENPSDTTARKIRIIRTVVKSEYSSKGHIMEQDADGLEYSSEDDNEEEMENVFCKKSKADSIITDHEKIYYRKFRKDFYVEVPEIAKMTLEEVAAYREEMDMKIRGKNCPKPIKTWAQCITYVSVLDILRKSNFEKPTPIQAQALPLIASGRDMLGIAKTGSGKTLAFVLPMLRHIKHQPRLEPDDGPIALIMTPTRELAMQISKECRKFGKPLDLRVAAVYGGTGISEQIAELKRGAEIVVCTPGRMIDMIAANNGRVTNLRRITYVVLDEADRMFDLGFEPQVTKILETIRPDRQTVMFSATFPRQMEALARKALTKPVEVTVGGRSVVCGDVEQNVVVLNEDQKYLKLLELLGIYQEHGGVLVFVHKQEHADELMKNLMQNAYPCMALHGGLDQYDRDSVIADFKNGAIKLLIATSVAARGLDVKDLILVVNYDCPNHFEDYIHRCGRTGRAGNKGAAFTFITPGQERYAGDIIKALEQSGAEVNWELQQLWDNYVNKMAAEGKTVKTGGGFSGKGFKFNEEEELFSDDRKRAQKAMFNLQDSDDEDSLDIDQEIDKAFKSKTRIKETNALEAQGGNSQSFSTAEKLAFARQVAAKINLQRPDAKEFAQPSSSLFMKGNNFGMSYSSKTVAEQIAERLNNKLNYIPKEKEEISQQNEFKVYEEELEINDFPQNARWKVTSKETLTHIAEYAEAGITVRGQYFPPGKQPPMGERKLYLAIESLSERSLQLAKGEITRIIKEEMLKMQNPALQLLNRGRYKVL